MVLNLSFVYFQLLFDIEIML